MSDGTLHKSSHITSWWLLIPSHTTSGLVRMNSWESDFTLCQLNSPSWRFVSQLELCDNNQDGMTQAESSKQRRITEDFRNPRWACESNCKGRQAMQPHTPFLPWAKWRRRYTPPPRRAPVCSYTPAAALSAFFECVAGVSQLHPP